MPSTDTSGPTTTTGEQSQRQTDRGEVPANMYIITCGNENEIVMEPETGYVPNNPLFGLPQSQLDKVSNRPPQMPFWSTQSVLASRQIVFTGRRISNTAHRAEQN